MATFAYTARDESGQTQAGTTDAVAASMVVAQLRDRGWTVLNIERTDGQAGEGLLSSFRKSFNQPRGIKVELSLRQLAVMLRGGISLLGAMQTIATQSDSRGVRLSYEQMIAEIEQGKNFSEALEAQSGFPELLVRLVRVGERTGLQEQVLVQAANIMRDRRKVLREILTALSYPAIVFIAAIGAAIFMMTTLIPKLVSLLDGLGKPLPPITRSLVVTAKFFEEWAPTMLLGLFITGIIVTALYLTPTSRLVMDRWVLRVPVIGKIFRLSGTLTFSQTLGTLVQSGVTVLDGLTTVKQMHANTYFALIAQNSRDSVIRGNNLADSLRQKGGYMSLLGTMTAVGEQSGTLDEVLEEVTNFHRAQLSGMIAFLSATITPAIIVAVGSVVGYIYIAFFVGMFAVAG